MACDPSGVKVPIPEGQLKNDDIPGFNGSRKYNKILKDQYYNSMKQSSFPKNGTGYSIRGSTGLLPNVNLKDQAFMLDGAIDPNKIRLQTRHDYALPSDYSTGNLLTNFNNLQTGDYKASSNTQLLKDSNYNYINYKNRFNPQIKN